MDSFLPESPGKAREEAKAILRSSNQKIRTDGLLIWDFSILGLLDLKDLSAKGSRGLPWWFSGKESACQCRRHGFDNWSGKIPHATEELSLCATATEPVF